MRSEWLVVTDTEALKASHKRGIEQQIEPFGCRKTSGAKGGESWEMLWDGTNKPSVEIISASLCRMWSVSACSVECFRSSDSPTHYHPHRRGK